LLAVTPVVFNLTRHPVYQFTTAFNIDSLIPFTVECQYRAGYKRQLASDSFNQSVDLVDAGERSAPIVVLLRIVRFWFYLIGPKPF
jgi:hypothetical protein